MASSLPGTEHSEGTLNTVSHVTYVLIIVTTAYIHNARWYVGGYACASKQQHNSSLRDLRLLSLMAVSMCSIFIPAYLKYAKLTQLSFCADRCAIFGSEFWHLKVPSLLRSYLTSSRQSSLSHLKISTPMRRSAPAMACPSQCTQHLAS